MGEWESTLSDSKGRRDGVKKLGRSDQERGNIWTVYKNIYMYKKKKNFMLKHEKNSITVYKRKEISKESRKIYTV